MHGNGWGLVASAVFKTVCGALTCPGWVRFLHVSAISRIKGCRIVLFVKKHNAAPFLCIYVLLRCLSYLLGDSCYGADYSFHLLFSIEQTQAQAASSLLKRTHGLMCQWCAMQTASGHNPVFLF